MRKLTQHIVSGDKNPQLTIKVLDEPGQGNANHLYEISYPGGITLDENGKNVVGEISTRISFQNGPIKEFGINGLTHEALLTILIDRLEGFQAGPFSCMDNRRALYCLKDSLYFLQKRTKDRIKREVEGTNQL